jgi:hypothetical protein
MIRKRRLVYALATFLALQPAIGFVCQLDCRAADSLTSVQQRERDISRTGCHDDARTANKTTLASIGVPAHGCDHLSVPATTPAVEKVHRPEALIDAQVLPVRLLRQPKHRSIQPHDTHAPPGNSLCAIDVLRV